MKRALILALGTCLAAAPLTLGAFEAAAQPKASGYKAPRNAFGQPDLSGYWSNVSLTPETRPASFGDRLVYTEEEVAKIENAEAAEAAAADAPTDPNEGAPKVGGELSQTINPAFAAAGGAVGGYNRGWLESGSKVMRVNGQPRTSILTTPNGQPPPRKAGAPAPTNPYARIVASGGRIGQFDSYEIRSLGERCILSFGRNAGPPMLPNGFYNNNYQFVQTKDHFIIEVEMVHDLRIVRLNDKEHRKDGVRPWFGDSIGWWEGDTLVVETTNLPQRMAYRGSWENLKVTERFTRVGPQRIHYQFTIDDPTMWEKSWGGEYEFSPLDGQIYEYACHEGNHALPGMLRGARVEEAEQAKAPRAAGAGSAP
ncbi:hypothetical protein [Phenylobacterium sp.]|uniref:hypothetical protein n=1 Tax=Phenylobacterium sp. TaxID=1871053 RepID=UPI002E30D398|nr:hypothetical protein [Phenylobacterium sp.]HEX2559409.1 hypothetical protein [Phenylobacterium sp.]